MLLSISCTDSKPDRPALSWENSPGPTTYTYGDTLLVKFRVQEEASIRYQIIQGDEITSISGKLVGKANDLYEIRFILDDRYLPSASYTIRVTAENEGGAKSAFQSFSYQELPRKQTGYLLLSNDRLRRISSGQVSSISGSFPARLEVSSRSRQFLLWDKSKAQELYDLDSLQRLKSSGSPGAGQNWLKVVQADSRFLVGQYPRSIASWSSAGRFSFRYNFPDSIEIADLGYHEGKLSVITREPGRSASYLSVLFPGLRGLKREKYLGKGTFHLAGSESGEGLGLLQEQNGMLSMYEYRATGDRLLLRYRSPAGAVKKVKPGPGSSLLAQTDQGLFQFPYGDQASGAILLSPGDPDDFTYHRVSGAVIVLEDQQLRQINGSRGAAPIPAYGAHSFAIIYNK